LLTLLVVPTFYDSIEINSDRMVAKFHRRDERWNTAGICADLAGSNIHRDVYPLYFPPSIPDLAQNKRQKIKRKSIRCRQQVKALPAC
jgi:acyl-CoA synthetase (AMP-forming)/AMP-acid ligase II